ncbi:MAG: DEAD/DEAH box helicase [Deltaproteobacteria bacterium]|nr:DEAD/DEAH box helicase [Deltaproteobacteria bacterium]
MKYKLPENHGLSDSIVARLIFKDGDKPLLTDIQYEALVAGVGRGESVLIVAPTSTGKTHIALWAIARSIESGNNTVYLVTHRALAKQKFDDFKTHMLQDFLGNVGSSLVIATGDHVENAEGDIPSEPLRSPLLVATYEKYLALLSASGIPSDMRSVVVVCDEIQLIGDEHRGQNVEMLLTLVKNAGWKQFVGLSAVLEPTDAKDLANWLNVIPVINHAREKHTCYECWSPKGIATVTTERPDTIEEGLPIPGGCNLDPLSVLDHFLKQKKPPVPIIVFCTRSKQNTYDFAEQLLAKYEKSGDKLQLSLAFDGLPETSANSLLARLVAHRIAIHSTDLTDEERHVVEQYLLQGKLDVVFATPTLSAGVNFPLGAAIFANWDRWDRDQRVYVSIENAEFHNMAGRVGRMGFEHDIGRVVFIARSGADIIRSRQYLNLGMMPALEPRIQPDRFNQLALQLVASGLCNSKDEIKNLVCTTFSALREQDRNSVSFMKWPTMLSDAIDELVDQGMLIQATGGRITPTPIGKAVAYSGLLPETGVFLLDYVARKVDRLVTLLPKSDSGGDMHRLAFLLFCACFSSPEFRIFNRKSPTRFLPWPLDTAVLFNADVYRDDLPDPVWQADLSPINAAMLTLEWVNGAEIAALEKMLPQLSAGMLREMNRNLVWILQGLASIITAGTDSRTSAAYKPKALRESGTRVDLIGKLPRVIRRLSFRVAEGLPDEVLWMTELNTIDSNFRITRGEILSLCKLGYTTPEKVMLGSSEADEVRVRAFAKVKPAPQAKANWLRDTCRNWKVVHRKRMAGKHLKRARRCPEVKLVEKFYKSTATQFEEVFEEILNVLKIKFERLDDRSSIGAPDYLVMLQDSLPLIIELKSREGNNLID